jgi:integrase
MRRGEVCALRWTNVDLDGGELAVCESIEETTPDGEHRLQVKSYSNSGLVVAQADGSLMSPNIVSHDFGLFIAASGLPDITFHDLRHSHASRLHDLGVGMKDLSERLGHSGIRTTQNLYTKPGREGDREAARRLEGMLGDGERREGTVG